MEESRQEQSGLIEVNDGKQKKYEEEIEILQSIVKPIFDIDKKLEKANEILSSSYKWIVDKEDALLDSYGVDDDQSLKDMN